MFVPVACTNCGKPFQVAQSQLGQSVKCPWCQSLVPAIPVAGAILPPAPNAAAQSNTQPLSLDDDPATERPELRVTNLRQPQTARNTQHSSRWWRQAAIGLVLSVLIAGLTVAVRGYHSGRIPETGWNSFTLPDNSCSILLHGTPQEESVVANPAGSTTGGKRYLARGWYTGTTSWIACNELDPGFAKTIIEKDQAKVFSATAIDAELTREKTRLQATVTKQAELRLNSAWGVEVHLETPTGKAIEWFLVVADNPRPRLYVFGLQAKNITPDSVVVRAMFTSFRVHN